MQFSDCRSIYLLHSVAFAIGVVDNSLTLSLVHIAGTVETEHLKYLGGVKDESEKGFHIS